uniref:Uncharacterized protein n=1 Tax=Palpitomonas bilix TaxID=652834 RepID=A0A7S3CXR0_9EUKA|mmetsp:Transcript_13947/g.35921  ORF Transcript_13947/g.35921 Transcript_13947/m.35921 type:complete len:163 (+) Transcript_13947:223-711(+)
MFKKKKAGNLRKKIESSAPAEDDSTAASILKSVEDTKLLQKERKKTKGLDLSVGASDVVAVKARVQEEDITIERDFQQETKEEELDPNMLKYIEEKRKKQRGGEASAKQGGKEEDGEEVEEEDGKKMEEVTTTLPNSGIVEVQLPMQYKITLKRLSGREWRR